MHDWNVVVTVQPEGFTDACRILAELGTLARTPYFNVLVMRVDDPRRLLERLTERIREHPGLRNFISHVVPVTDTFDFDTATAFEQRATEIVEGWMEQLKNRSFHVRMHRRGLRDQISSQEEARRLGEHILEGLQRQGATADVEFDDPDVVVSVETIDQRAGLSLWTRADIEQFGSLLGIN